MRLLSRIGLFVALAAEMSIAQAQYPDKPIRLVVGYPPGSTADVISRTIGIKLGELMGQPVVIQNRPGAGGSIATESVARARADGYTLLLSTTADVINPSVIADVKYDFARDLLPLVLLAENPVVLIAPGTSPMNNLADVINAARAAPGKITFASAGNGTLTHLYGELFSQSAHIRLTHVPYKGAPQAMTDLLAARVDLSFTPVTAVLPQIKAGKLKALAVVGGKHMAALPDVPTFEEAGLKGFDSALWFGLSAPAGTPRPIVDKLASETLRALASPDVKEQLTAQSVELIGGDMTKFAATISRDLMQWKQIAKAAGIKPE